MKKESTLIPGMSFIGKDIKITVTSIDEEKELINVIVIKPGKPGVQKSWNAKKFAKKIEGLTILDDFNTDQSTKTVTGVAGTPGQPAKNCTGFMINMDKLVNKTLRIQPNDHGVESVYIFSVNPCQKTVLIGEDEHDEKPKWMPADSILQQVMPEDLQNLSSGSINASSTEELAGKAVELFKKLAGK